MHIVDGVLATPVLIGGAAITVAGIGLGLRALPMERIPVAGMMSAAFFVASLIHVPVGPTSVHLILSGLAGMILGWTAFPALFVGLLLQAVFFGFGGITVLGVNAANIALPAVVIGLLLRSRLATGSPRAAAIWAGVGGGLSISLTTLCVGVSLALSGDEFLPAARLVFVAHVPVMVVEGLLSAAAVWLIVRAKPELLGRTGVAR